MTTSLHRITFYHDCSSHMRKRLSKLSFQGFFLPSGSCFSLYIFLFLKAPCMNGELSTEDVEEKCEVRVVNNLCIVL